MKRMPRSLSSCIWRFVDQHRMNSHDVLSSKSLNVVEDLVILAVVEQLLVQEEVLQFVDCIFIPWFILKRDVLLNEKSRYLDFEVCNVFESLLVFDQLVFGDKISNHDEAILFVELPLCFVQFACRRKLVVNFITYPISL